MIQKFCNYMIMQARCIAVALILWLTFIPLVAGIADLLPSGAVDRPQGHSLLENLGEQLLVLDVRTPQEFAQGHVSRALLIPLPELEKRLGKIPIDRPILIVCRTGRRAAIAYDVLTKARPEMLRSGLWCLKATPSYRHDGNFIFL